MRTTKEEPYMNIHSPNLSFIALDELCCHLRKKGIICNMQKDLWVQVQGLGFRRLGGS